jgi:hypothetical protein
MHACAAAPSRGKPRRVGARARPCQCAEGCSLQVTSSMGKQYGKDKMFDGCADTCWQSKEGKPQSITLEFDRARFRTTHAAQMLRVLRSRTHC